MYSLSYLAVEYFIVLLTVRNEIAWINCDDALEVNNSDLWKSRRAKIVYDLNKLNSSYNAIKNFDLEDLEKLKGKDQSLNIDSKNMISNYYDDFNIMHKRNAFNNHKTGKRKQLIKHKKPSKDIMTKVHQFRRKGNEQQRKRKINNIKHHKYEETSLYENSKNPLSCKSKNNPKYSINSSYKNSKNTQTLDESIPDKISLFNGEEDDNDIDKIKEGVCVDKDEIHKGKNTVIEDNKRNSVGLPEAEIKNSKYLEDKIDQQENDLSESRDEYAKKAQHYKLKRKQLNKQTGMERNEKDIESQVSKRHRSNISTKKPSDRDLYELKSLFAKSVENFDHRNISKTDISLLSLSNKKNNTEKQITRNQNAKDSDDVEFYDIKVATVKRKCEKPKLNNDINVGDNVFESNKHIEEGSCDNGLKETGIHNEKNYLQSEKKPINISSFDHANHKINHEQAQNYHGRKFAFNHNSQNKNFDDEKNMKQRKRTKKRSPLEIQHDPIGLEREDHESNKETEIRNSNLITLKNINSLQHIAHSNKTSTNKRNQRDIKKRLSKHNKHHMGQESNIFGYLKNSDEENEDSNFREVHNGQGSYNTKKVDDNAEYLLGQDDDSSNIDDNYSYKMSLEDEARAVDDEDNMNTKYNRKKTFPRQSHETRQQGESTEKCVNYKAEKVTKKPTACTSATTTEKSTTKGTSCATKRTTTVKAKTTLQSCNKSIDTKNIESVNRKNNSSSETLDVFERYLGGQLADDFVDAVMDKVKKSRKIYKELGFRNDSEETCDRCIETKPNKMPDKDLMKLSIGKLLKNNEHRSSCFKCYSVPKPMEKVLNLLVLFEKEHENCVYNKIRDDSSFIFTGDYPEQFNQNDNSAESKHNNYASNSFNKETFDKQDLREDNNEDKHNDQVANRNSIDDEYTTLEAENKQVKYSTDAGIQENEDIDEISQSKINNRNNMKNRNINVQNNKDESSFDLDENNEENDFKDDFDINVAQRRKYSSREEPDIDKPDDSYDKASIKQRRKAFKSDRLLGSINSYITPEGIETKAARRNFKSDHLRKQNFNVIDKEPSKDGFDYENQPLVPKKHDGISAYDSDKQCYKIPYQFKTNWPHSEDNKLSHHSYVPSDKYGHKRNQLDYLSEDYNNDEGDHIYSQNNAHSVADGFMSTGWDRNEYQLLPKLPDHEDHVQNILNSVPRKRYHRNSYEERLNMVKRESEPNYEDEPLFFEIPNIEYDLY